MKKTYSILFLILLLAAFLRFYQLGNNPPALDWDEASMGYNAYSLLKTGKDEFGRVWPISIRSFEDYKPAVYTYLIIPSIALFGLNEFATRLPSAVFGTLTVLITYFLVKELIDKERYLELSVKSEKITLLVTFFLAISPWHLQFSRVAFESNTSLFFVFSGLLFFLKGLKKGAWLLLAAILLSISFYTYHAPRLVVPLIILGWTIYYRGAVWKQKKFVICAIFIGLFLLIPFFKESFGPGRARLSSVTVLSADGRLEDSIKRTEYDEAQGNKLAKILHNRRIIYALAVAKGYLDHFNLDFLFLTGDAPDRHHARDMGMLYIWEAPFIALAIIMLLKKRSFFPIIWWFLVAPSASAITTGTPHAVRALLYLPTYQIFSALGLLLFFYNWKLPRQSRRRAFALVFVTIMIFINIFYYFQMYYVHTPVEASADWQYGYKQAIAATAPFENTTDKIIMTYSYDQPYIFVLFYRQVDPAWYQQQWHGQLIERARRSFGKYEFRTINWEQDKNLTNTILVGTPGEIPDSAPGKIAEIRFLDGSIAFRIVKR